MAPEIREDEGLLSHRERPTLRTTESLTSHSVRGCCAKTCLFGFGGVIGVVGLMLGLAWPVIINAVLASKLALKPGSQVYDKWVETPIPLYQKLWLFNWTNPEESLRGGVKPVFVEMGPYVFLEHHSKKNITWNANNTVTYFNQKQYHFVPEMSNGSLSDRVTNLNVIAFVVGWYCRNLSYPEKVAVGSFIALEEISLIKTDTAGNLLYNGSVDPMLKIFDKIRPFFKGLPDMKKFAWFYGKNMTLTGDGVFTMGTGQDDINKVGLLTEWNYKNRTKFRGACGKVQGTYGEELPPNSVEQDQILIFANDLCGVVPLTRDTKSSMMNVPSVVFLGKEDTFSNSTTCYCETDTSCPATGVRDLSTCRNAPIMMSWPHFYLADPVYREAIVGMNPDASKHQFYMELAEVTSVPMSVRARMQINLHLHSIKDMPFFKNLPDIVVPMIWFSQEASMTSEMASQLSILVKAVDYGRWVLLGGGAVGGLLILIGLVLRSRGCFSHSDERLLQ